MIYSHNHCQQDNIIRYEDEENEILGIFKTNAMIISRWRRKYFQFHSDKMSTPGSLNSDNVNTVFTSWKSALFPKICRANHSCVPNCNYVWNPELGQQQMFLVKKVKTKYSFSVITGCIKRKHNYGPKIITKLGCWPSVTTYSSTSMATS